MSEEGTGQGTYLTQDEPSYTDQRRKALDNCADVYIRASRPVRGAAARVQAAQADLDNLRIYDLEVVRLTAHSTFHDLPEMKVDRDRPGDFRFLTVGPWRGVFLVHRDGTSVVGLTFSKHPHALEDHLMEIASRYRAASSAAEEKES